MRSKRVLVVNVVASPELHADSPRNQELGQSAPDERGVLEQSAALLFVEVSVLKHGRVRIEVSDARSLLLGCICEGPESHKVHECHLLK